MASSALKPVSQRGIDGDARCSGLALDVGEDVSREVKLINRKGPLVLICVVIQRDFFPYLNWADEISAEIPAQRKVI